MCVFLALGPVPVPTAGLECFAWSQSHHTRGHSYSACVGWEGWEGADKRSPRHPWQVGSWCLWGKGSPIFQETQRKLSLRMSGLVLQAVTLGGPPCCPALSAGLQAVARRASGRLLPSRGVDRILEIARVLGAR